MTTLICSPGFLQLVIFDNVWEEVRGQRQRFPFLPGSPDELHRDLARMRSGISAVVVEGDSRHVGGPKVQLYTTSFYLEMVSTPAGDAYKVLWIKPLGLDQQKKLVQGALRLQVGNWYLCGMYAQLQRGYSNYLPQIQQQWNLLQKQMRVISPPAYALNQAHERYLHTLDRLVEIVRQLALDAAPQIPPLDYSKVEATGEERHNLRDVYIFHLVSGSPELERGNFVRLRDAADLRGRILSTKKNQITVKFESGAGIDLERIPSQGVLEVIPVIETPFRIQHQAIETIGEGEAQNPHILPLLVENTYQPYVPVNTMPDSDARLNAAQTEAFRRAIAARDVLLVLGPPGTGKTKTITEIARHHAMQQHNRVLVTSRTHRAVDNVLEHLPQELTLVRIGHEDRVSEQARAFLIDNQAQTLQRKILSKTEALYERLSQLVGQSARVDQKTAELAGHIAKLRDAEKRLQQAISGSQYLERAIDFRYGGEIRRLQAALKDRSARLDHLSQLIASVAQQHVRVRASSHILLLKPFWLGWGRFLRYRADHYGKQWQSYKTAFDVETQAHAQAIQTYHQALYATDYPRLKQQEAQTRQECQTAAQSASNAFDWLKQAVAGLIEPPPPLASQASSAFESMLAWFQSAFQMLQGRQTLMREWRQRLNVPAKDLYPVLIRFADVVGATCIGIATSEDFKDVDFDLVIADEAGQIGVHDLLVPLVRARRALLVGDHHQLPPFVEREVQDWLKQLSEEQLEDLGLAGAESTLREEEIKNLLSKSIFEILFQKADPAHVVRLSEQYRMPQSIADFASKHFYQQEAYRLETKSEEKIAGASHHDPLFAKPMVFIDTSTLPLEQRQEVDSKRNESRLKNVVRTGYSNPVEAALIADLAAFYEQEKLNWIVIVPYRAQAQRIRQELKRRLSTHDDLDERISTVDSFQGGECARVLYSFTRSNSWHGIGFLNELRRLNVAITRAQEQLVLVGDAPFLSHVDDTGFRDLAVDLVQHIRQTGEWLSYQECQARLRQKGQRR
jgi:DNA polymerase III delta prime subunit